MRARWLALLLSGCNGAPAGAPSAAPAGASDPAALVRAVLAKAYPSATIEVSSEGVPTLPLEGLTLLRAWPKLPDALARACFVHGGGAPGGQRKAACTDDAQALPALLRAYGLPEKPERLDDAQWIALATFAAAVPAVSSGAEARRLVPKLPDDVAAGVTAPSVARERDRLTVTWYALVVANDVGPIGVARHELAVSRSGVVSHETRRLFSSL